MDHLDLKPTLSQAHPETMDFLSHSWCDFAVQAFQPEVQDQQSSSIVVHDNYMMSIDNNKPNYIKMDKNVSMGDTSKTIPPWKSNDVKSWIWMQQAMHPELNYNSCFRKKWVPWKLGPLKHFSIKKWIKEIKQKRKDDQRLQRAEVHAAISVAGVAAALAAIAAENSSTTTKDAAVATAAALVAAQCMKVAEAMGAKKDKLNGVMSSAMSGTSATDHIVTLTAAATTSLRGAATLKARSGMCKNKLNGGAPVLPIEGSHDFDFEFQKNKSILAKGAKLPIETSNGKFLTRLVSIISNDDGKVILVLRKSNVLGTFTKEKECIVLDLYAELYKDPGAGENETCYLIVLTTNKGIIKLDMMDNHQLYKSWSMAINHMLMFSTPSTKSYDLQLYK